MGRITRWLKPQFSVRFLLILMLIAGGGLMLYLRMLKVQQQRRAAAHIESEGGNVLYFVPHGSSSADQLTLIETPDPPGPRWQRNFLGDAHFSHGVRVVLFATHLTTYFDSIDGGGGNETVAMPLDSETFKMLELLPRLDVLSLNGTPYSPKQASSLRQRFTNLTIED